MYKRKISIFLLIIFIFNFFSINVLADTIEDDPVGQFKLIVIGAGMPFSIKKGSTLEANLNTYKTYNKIVYGSPRDVPENSDEGNYKQGEYRYLGYDVRGTKVTNEKFKDDDRGSLTYEQWNYVDVTIPDSGAKESWRNFDPLLIDYNWTTKWFRNGEQTTMSAEKIGSFSKVKLQTPATLFSEGAVVINHNEGRKTWYASFTVQPMGNQNDFKGDIEPDSYSYVFEPKDNSIDIDLNLHGELNPSNKNYKSIYVNGMTVRVMKVIIDEGKLSEEELSVDFNRYGISKSEVLNVNKDVTMTFKRSDFTEDIKHSITFIGYASFASKFGDLSKIPIEKKVMVTIEETHKPTAEIVTDYDKVYEGEPIRITGIGKDEKENSKDLTYIWKSDPKINLSDRYDRVYGGVGNEVNLKPGEYNLSLTVYNSLGEKDTAKKKIEVVKQGKPIIDLTADNTPKEIKFKVQEDAKGKIIVKDEDKTKDIAIEGHGTVKGLENTNKKVKRLVITVVGASDKKFNNVNIDEQVKIATNKTYIDGNFTFNINLEDFITNKKIDTFTEYFKVKLDVTYDDGSREEPEERVLQTIFTKKSIPQPKPDPPTPKNYKPIPSISCSSRVTMGNDLRVRGYAADRDDDPEDLKLKWVVGDEFDDAYTNSQTDNLGGGELKDYGNAEGGGSIWFKKEGKATIVLKAFDPVEEGQWDYEEITILPAIPHSNIDIDGKRKVNRKLTFSAANSFGGSKRYPIDWNNCIWEITPYNGNTSVNDIKTLYDYSVVQSGGKKKVKIKGANKEIDLLFKKAGQYNIKLTLNTTAGTSYSDSSEVIVTIASDLPPIAHYATLEKVIRDPKDNNYAAIPAIDNSSSQDCDAIDKRIWFYALDKDNDGNFEEEQWYVLHNNNWVKVQQFGVNNYKDLKNIDITKINSGNKTRIEIKRNSVGKTLFGLIVSENLLDETIPEFISKNDILRSHTFNGAIYKYNK